MAAFLDAYHLGSYFILCSQTHWNRTWSNYWDIGSVRRFPCMALCRMIAWKIIVSEVRIQGNENTHVRELFELIVELIGCAERFGDKRFTIAAEIAHAMACLPLSNKHGIDRDFRLPNFLLDAVSFHSIFICTLHFSIKLLFFC